MADSEYYQERMGMDDSKKLESGQRQFTWFCTYGDDEVYEIIFLFLPLSSSLATSSVIVRGEPHISQAR